MMTTPQSEIQQQPKHVDRYAVIGNPIAHSKSPQIHTLFAQETQQRISYERLLAPLEGFKSTVQKFIAEGGAGANVTVPFKIEAFALATTLSARAQAAGAVNTLKFDVNGIYGDNTDGIGLVRDLMRHQVALRGKRILLLGAGGAARGAILPLLEQQPAELVIANRTLSKALELISLFEKAATTNQVNLLAVEFAQLNERFDCVINATAGSLQGIELDLPKQIWHQNAFAYDMMYGAEATLFMKQAMAQGARVADGLGMLVEQAAESFALWRGVRPSTLEVLTQLKSQLQTQSK